MLGKQSTAELQFPLLFLSSSIVFFFFSFKYEGIWMVKACQKDAKANPGGL